MSRQNKRSSPRVHEFTVGFSYHVTYEGSIGIREKLDVNAVVDRAHRILAHLRPEQVHKIATYHVGKIEIGDVILQDPDVIGSPKQEH